MAPAPADALNGFRVLVIDDERNIRSTLALCLETFGCTVEQADSAGAAMAKLAQRPADLAFLDLRLGEANGLELLPGLLEACPGLIVVVITAYGTIDTAVEAMKRGAADFLPKPFTPSQIRHVVERARERAYLERRVATLQEQITEVAPEIELSTRSPQMRDVLEKLEKAAAFEVGLLLLGESGTGKSVLARRVHDLSPRRGKPFVVINCPTLSEELLASEMFGHTKGAFTGAVRDQAGRVEAVAGGTLFLDEIGEIPSGLQAKLLRFLQDKHFERLGETRTRVADARIIAATNRELGSEVQAGRFREDLYYRLNAVEVTVPPLRERREDILPLAETFLAFFSRSMRRPPAQLTAEAKAALTAHGWPGNVRELRNLTERALIFSKDGVIGTDLLSLRPSSAPAGAPEVGGDVTIDELEREHLERVVARTANLEEAARILGIDASTLYRKRRRKSGG